MRIHAESLEARRHFSVGQPDLSFGDNGTLEAPAANFAGGTVSAALADGRFVLVTTDSSGDGQSSLIEVRRYLADGTADPSFGGAGGLPAGVARTTVAVDFGVSDVEVDATGR